MSFRKKIAHIFNPTLMSGSDDIFRTQVGGGLTQHSDPDGRFGTYIRAPRPGNVVAPNLLGIDPKILTLTTLNQKNVGELSGMIRTSQLAVPIIRYAGRILGAPDMIENDLHWATFVYGGLYMDTEYKGLFSENEFYDHWFRYDIPFTTLEIQELARRRPQLAALDEINVSYEYNRYMRKYEKHVSTLENERLIPSLYLLQSLSEADNTLSDTNLLYTAYNRNDINFVSMEDMISSNVWSDLLKDQQDIDEDENISIKELRRGNKTKRANMRRYLDHSVPRGRLSDETKTAISTKYNNVMFDADAMANILHPAEANKNLFPYYAKISFEAREAKKFSDEFNRADFTSKFLVALKEVFGPSPKYSVPDKTDFIVQTEANIKKNQKNTMGRMSVRLTDFGILLNQARTSYISPMNDYCFVGRQDTSARKSATDKTGIYRFNNTDSSTRALLKYLDFADDAEYLSQIKTPFEYPEFVGKYNETVAYRIEKVGGPATGDAGTQNAIQNFWFINSRELYDRTSDAQKEKDFNFFDTQVKYGSEYTYNIYAYVIVAGSRYKMSDQRITRVIATLDEGEDGSKAPFYCLEFYDPSTGETKNKLYYGSESGDKEPESEFMTDAQINNTNKYIADFNITVQPSIKLIEIPLTSKKIKVLDSPPNQAQALPFQIEDDTNRIGFDIEYTPSIFEKFPLMVSEADFNYKDQYMRSNDLLPGTKIKQESISYPRYLEIFRTDVEPTKYADFDGKLHKTIDLKLKNSQHTLKEYVFYDKVETNINYYYMFRFVNEHLSPGRPSAVHIASLQDDGGFKYPLFEIFDFAKQAAKNKSEQTVQSFKKIISIGPSLQHMVFDEDTFASSQNSTDVLKSIKLGISKSPVWNRKFKFRLTSKKTGKKIDFNITYNLKSE